MRNLKTTSKRLVSAALACAIAVALLAGGTLAWTTFSQMAQNMTLVDGLDDSLIGARLRDDFDGANKDVYVENFGTQPVFIRVSLYEFAERGPEAGDFANPGRDATPFISTANFDDVSTWRRHTHATATDPTGNTDATNPFREYWQWGMGGSKIYTPTFNRDQDCLRSDITGPSTWAAANASDEYQAMVRDPQNHTTPAFNWNLPGTQNQWTAGQNTTGVAQFTGGENASVQQSARATLTPSQTCNTALPAEFPGVVTMAWWLANGEPNGDFWVMDTDGWFYWASPLMPEENYTVHNDRRLPSTATSLLLDYIALQGASTEMMFYVIHVNMQATSLDDLDQMGSEDGAVSDNARRLLDGAAEMLHPPVNPAADVPVGGTFVDAAGITWRVLYVDNNGNRLVITEHAYGNEVPGQPFEAIRYHSAVEFVPLRSAEINGRLTRFWGEMGGDMRSFALPVNLGADFRPSFVYAGFPIGPNNVESNPHNPAFAAQVGPGNTGFSNFTTGIANSTNAMFILSLVETGFYFNFGYIPLPAHNGGNNDAIAACRAGTPRYWWMRSPGYNAISQVADIGPGGYRGAAIGNITSANNGVRPALWVQGNAPAANPGYYTPVGERFTDANGISWTVLTIDENGNRLIATHNHLLPSVQYHSVNTFVTLSNSDGARPALNAFWNTIDPALRVAARPAAGIDTDVFSAPTYRNLPAENAPAGLTFVNPANPPVTANNALFILSLSEYNRYNPPTGRPLTMGNQQYSIWLRSPGGATFGGGGLSASSAPQLRRFFNMGSWFHASYNNTASSAYLHPVMWIAGQAPATNADDATRAAWSIELTQLASGELELVVAYDGATPGVYLLWLGSNLPIGSTLGGSAMEAA